MSRKPTWKEKQAAWHARQRKYQRTIQALRQQLARRDRKLEDQLVLLDDARREHEQRHREQVKNWNLYDKAYAEVSAQEQALFETSPAYLKYKQWRESKAVR